MAASALSRTMLFTVLFSVATSSVTAETRRVPLDHKSIQSAIDVANAGDTVLVSAGTYREGLSLRAGVIVKSGGTTRRESSVWRGPRPLFLRATAGNRKVPE